MAQGFPGFWKSRVWWPRGFPGFCLVQREGSGESPGWGILRQDGLDFNFNLGGPAQSPARPLPRPESPQERPEGRGGRRCLPPLIPARINERN